MTAGAGQNTSRLLARRAGVHVDLHANRHFNDLWSLPSHWGLPRDGATLHHHKRKTAARSTQGSVGRMSQIGLFQQTKQSSSCRRSQFLGVERSVGVGVGCIETLLGDGQILVQRQSTIVIGISGSLNVRFRVAQEVTDLLAASESNAQGGFHETTVSSAVRAATPRIHLLRSSPGRNAPRHS
jgi:hypothetical protein